ncbi:MAG: helix-turn-helix transcriptional regulator [Acutalibacteraceae bacterium]|nr:helix-turn-helix transcriptional regulator [Acutalibacteraceae bacterium]
MNDYKYEMGLRIKKQRKLKKFTQEQMAEQLGISVKHFSEVERGLTGLSIENLIKLSNILDVTIDHIVKGKPNENSWNNTLEKLKTVPEEKIPHLKELISLSIELTK